MMEGLGKPAKRSVRWSVMGMRLQEQFSARFQDDLDKQGLEMPWNEAAQRRLGRARILIHQDESPKVRAVKSNFEEEQR